MSSSADYIASVALAQVNLYRIGGPILIVIGTISSIVSLFVFTQKNLRKNSCSICFIALNIDTLLYIYLSQLIDVLQVGFSIDPSMYNLTFCRIRFYLTFLLGSLGPSYFVLACIDRACITSSNARTRRWSSFRTVLIGISGVTLFWMIFHIHALIYTVHVQFGPNYFLCYIQSGTYTDFVSYFALIYGFIPLVLMTVCGVLTIRNLRNSGRVNAAFVLATNTRTMIVHSRKLSPKERQLILMCVAEIFLYTIFDFPAIIWLPYLQGSQYQIKSAERLVIEQLAQSIVSYSVHIQFSVCCYTNLIVSKTFRTEVKGLFTRARAACFDQRTPIEPIVGRMP
jgi:hypothetical protein